MSASASCWRRPRSAEGSWASHVETYVFPDGRPDVRWKGISLPYRAFDPDQQHVTHAAIAENKRLGAVLEAIKELQEAAAPKVTTVGKQRTRYQPKGRRRPDSTPGKPSLAAE